jgi:predicted amidohydrolase YtcJ
MKLLHNARVYTLDPSKPQASAVVVDGGRVLAVGGSELKSQVGRKAEKIDLGKRVVMPGLIDAHLHLQYYSHGLLKVDCETCTHAECLERVRKHARKTRSKTWVLGHGWNQNFWLDSPSGGHDRSPGFGTAADLDAIVPDRPVYLTAKSLHAGWVNSAALHLAGIDANTPDPPKGKIQRDMHGRPTGILLESAMQLVEQVIPQPSVSQVMDAIRKAQPVLWDMGLTSVHDFDRRTCFMALQRLNANGELGLRIVKSIPLDDMSYAAALGLRTGFGDDFLRIGPVKIFMDGALGPRTAAMLQPYEQEPENRGILNMSSDELFELGCQAAESGLSLAVHAIGDRANCEVLNAFKRLRAYEKKMKIPALRHRIEHVQLLHPKDADRLSKLDIVASMQPVHAPSDMGMAERYWGRRSVLAYAWRTQLEKGARLAFGSDAPVESPNPFLGLHAAITRQRADGSPGPDGWYPEQRLTIDEAVAGFTTGAAYAAGMEDRLGRLSPGFLADLIVLDNDPFQCDPSDLLAMTVAATMVAGEWVKSL